jgi:protein MpaA
VPRTQARAALIGRSQQERDIVAYTLGSGPIPVAIVGGIHGAYEANTEWLVWDLLHFYEQTPEAIPRNITLLMLPEANPDGMANGTRFLADGVDPNRNWPTADWSPEAFGPTGELDGGGGVAPMSEPETVTLANWILQTHPVTVLSYHSAGGLVMGGPLAVQFGLVDAYLSGSPGYVAWDWNYYPVTGDFAQWAEDQGIPTIEVELLTHADPDTERSLAAVQAVLNAVAAAAR